MKLGILRKPYTLLYDLMKSFGSILDYMIWFLIDPSKFKKIKTNEIDKILIILIVNKKGNVGGNFCILGVFNYFKKVYPDIKISILVNKNTKKQFGNIPGINIIEYEGFKTLKHIKKQNFKVVFDLSQPNDFCIRNKNLKSIPYKVMFSSIAIVKIGKRIIKDFFITRKILFTWKMHEVNALFKSLESLGFKFPEKKLIFYYSKKEKNKVDNFLKKNKANWLKL